MNYMINIWTNNCLRKPWYYKPNKTSIDYLSEVFVSFASSPGHMLVQGYMKDVNLSKQKVFSLTSLVLSNLWYNLVLVSPQEGQNEVKERIELLYPQRLYFFFS